MTYETLKIYRCDLLHEIWREIKESKKQSDKWKWMIIVS